MKTAFTLTALCLAIVPAVAFAQTPRSDLTPLQVAQETAPSPVQNSEPRFERVMIVVLENADYDDALEQPFLASLASRGALLTQYFAVSHPSQPNYIALVSGSTHGVGDDSNLTIDVRHVGDLLEAKGLQWKVYAEHYPGGCFLGAKADGYVRKHAPFLSFANVQSDPGRCARIVAASTLAQDIKAGTLPDYSLYAPDSKNNGHNTSATYADTWLSTTFGPLLQDPRFTTGLLLVVTFDEDEQFWLFPSSNHVLTVLFGDSIQPGATSDKKYNHYSLLRLVEDRFDLGNLGENDTNPPAITGIWK
jgi:Phosphoesterase family